jgi:RNA polymerase sigma factor (sigma-70 family)
MLKRTDMDARDQLVQSAMREFEARLVRYACSILNDLDRARDVVQETFIKLYQQDPEQVNRALKSWLFTVCRNRCFDVMRKESRLVLVSDEMIANSRRTDEDPCREMQRQEANGEVIRFLERLPENQREVIRLKFQQDMSYKEISEVTNLSVSNVGFLIHTGLKRLRVMMDHQQASEMMP